MIFSFYKNLVKSRRRHFALFIGAILVFVTLLTATLYNSMLVYLDSPGPLKESKTIILPKGMATKAIVAKLYKEDIINHPNIFMMALGIVYGKQSLKSGEYFFTSSISPRQTINMLVDGKAVLRRITFPEGFTLQQIINRLDAEDSLSGKVFSTIEEGELLPETYFYLYGDHKERIIERMRQRMSETLEELWEKRDKSVPFKTAKEALILASIVEKETSVPDERPRIAGVFINRLNKGMKLQSDPTVTYAITRGERELGRMLKLSDLKIKSEYNTYYVKGLPLSAICNPGKASIEAVLRPMKTNELYFVVSKNGRHKFAKTFAEHNRNVIEYRKLTRYNKQNQ